MTGSNLEWAILGVQVVGFIIVILKVGIFVGGINTTIRDMKDDIEKLYKMLETHIIKER